MLIEGIKVVEDGQFSFHISFIIDGSNLETPSMENSTALVDVKEQAKITIQNHIERRDLANLNKIKTALDGKSIEV